MTARNSKEAHRQRCRQRALDALMTLWSDPRDARDSLRALRKASQEFGYCVCCSYKQKAKTGEVTTPLELSALDHLHLIIRNPQRDGDDGNLLRRLNHAERIIRLLYWSKKPLTDYQIHRRTGIFPDSAKAARQGLVVGGWITHIDRNGTSSNDRPMSRWALSDLAQERLQAA